MKAPLIPMLLVCGATVAALAAPGETKETKMTVVAMPAAVQLKIKEVVSQGRITEAVREFADDGAVVYEVSYVQNRTKFEAEFSADGKLLVLDEQISLAAAPAAVRATIEQATIGGRIEKIEKVTQEGRIYFEIEFTKDGQEQEVKIGLDGRRLPS